MQRTRARTRRDMSDIMTWTRQHAKSSFLFWDTSRRMLASAERVSLVKTRQVANLHLPCSFQFKNDRAQFP